MHHIFRETIKKLSNFLIDFANIQPLIPLNCHCCHDGELFKTGLEISARHWTKSDVKTTMSNVKSPYTWQSWLTHFWVVKNTLLTMQYIILLCLHYLLFYCFIILFMILLVFFSSDVRFHSYKEFFGCSLYVKTFLNFVTPDISLEVLRFFMFMTINKIV